MIKYIIAFNSVGLGDVLSYRHRGAVSRNGSAITSDGRRSKALGLFSNIYLHAERGADLFESGTDCLRRAAAHLPISLSIAMAALRWGCSCLVAAVNRRKLSSWGPSTKRTVFR
jgi:hypothetical protein